MTHGRTGLREIFTSMFSPSYLSKIKITDRKHLFFFYRPVSSFFAFKLITSFSATTVTDFCHHTPMTCITVAIFSLIFLLLYPFAHKKKKMTVNR